MKPGEPETRQEQSEDLPDRIGPDDERGVLRKERGHPLGLEQQTQIRAGCNGDDDQENGTDALEKQKRHDEADEGRQQWRKCGTLEATVLEIRLGFHR